MFIFIFTCVQYVLSTKIFTLSLVLPLSLSSLRRYQCLCLHFEPLNGQARFVMIAKKSKSTYATPQNTQRPSML
jgi:hypothetical protein